MSWNDIEAARIRAPDLQSPDHPCQLFHRSVALNAENSGKWATADWETFLLILPNYSTETWIYIGCQPSVKSIEKSRKDKYSSQSQNHFPLAVFSILVELMDPIEGDQKSCLASGLKELAAIFHAGKPRYHRTPLLPAVPVRLSNKSKRFPPNIVSIQSNQRYL